MEIVLITLMLMFVVMPVGLMLASGLELWYRVATGTFGPKVLTEQVQTVEMVVEACAVEKTVGSLAPWSMNPFYTFSISLSARLFNLKKYVIRGTLASGQKVVLIADEPLTVGAKMVIKEKRQQQQIKHCLFTWLLMRGPWVLTSEVTTYDW